LIFSKGSRGRKVISEEGKGACVRGDMTKEEWMQWTLDVWFVRGSRSKFHPATFPEEIPKRLIKLYTYQEEIILDPFMGSGTTGVACKSLNRKFIGIELDPEYFEIAKKRIQQTMTLFGSL
jgi:site-specific DNA-methyltransferase (adenine-specific)